MTIASCGGDADCDDVGVFDEFNSLTSQASGMASTLDITDQDQCNDFRSAIEDLINEAEDLEECVPDDDIADFMSNIEELRDDLSSLNCG